MSTPILIFDEYSTTVEEYLEGLKKLWEREKELSERPTEVETNFSFQPL